MDPTTMSAREIVAATTSGSLSATEVLTALIRRIEVREPQVKAWAHLDLDRALAAARRLDSSPERGPMHGVPIGVKDVLATKGVPTQHNSPFYRGHIPTADAACVQTLRAAGAIVLGKTTTTEFAASQAGGPTVNPHDNRRTPGGSSSGSGAAVADRHVPIALATQTGGSTIRPGSYNGIVAMKPTCRAISREGLKTFAPSTDTVGFCVGHLDDLDLLADVFQLVDRRPSTFRGLDSARIAVCRTPKWDAAEPATVEALDRAESLLLEAGAQVEELVLPACFDGAWELFTTVLLGEARVSFLHEVAKHPTMLRDELASYVDDRNTVTTAQLVEAYDKVALLRIEFDRIASDFDAVLTPSVPGEAPLGIDFTGDPVFCNLWSLLQVPVVNVPGFTGPHGMPVGLSVVSPRFTDRNLIKVANRVAELFAGAAKVPATRSGPTEFARRNR
ncbi:amidase [Nocardia sp. NPDC059239]|uniref:amidase n=1 Tax=unclassified Nocardia TaxID=2637762 RepID=UPI0036BDE158